MGIQLLPIVQVQNDSNLQTRYYGVNGGIASEYGDRMKDGIEFPPIIVFFDGACYHLADGFHRLSAARHVGLETIKADVRDGTKRDAEFFALTEANRDHGLRLSPDDKRKRVTRLLQDETWAKMSNREIARQTGTSHTFVSWMRQELTPKTLGDAELRANEQAAQFRDKLAIANIQNSESGNVATSTSSHAFKIGDRVRYQDRIGVIRDVGDNDPHKRYPGTLLIYFSKEDGGKGTSHRYAVNEVQPYADQKPNAAPAPEFVNGSAVITRTGHNATVISQRGREVTVQDDNGTTRVHHASTLRLDVDDDGISEDETSSLIDNLQDALMETFESESIRVIIPTLATVLGVAEGWETQVSKADFRAYIETLTAFLDELKT